MELIPYLKREEIRKITTNEELDEIVLREIGKKKFEEYKKLGKEFASRNTKKNVKIFYNFLMENQIHNYFKGLFFEEIKKEIPILNEEINNYDNVLDIGCNSGLKTAFYAANHPQTRFVGIDISEEPLKHAAELSRTYRLKNTDYALMDLSDLGFKEQFDLVMADHSLQESVNYEYCFDCGKNHLSHAFELKLEKIYNVMKPGKLIVVLTPSDKKVFKDSFSFMQENAGFKPTRTIEVNYTQYGRNLTDLIFIAEKE
ncbi:MAG: class I SAM-dependent methyltransferase [Nanoarchaeota archaeon]|nr:class I SAM-dependent methyltransferase [Nanoarchaeota archaeon]MBU1270485.1 class I SAM-dependent methyltransferase [Nanoarchaeota archaeon]MBU1603698.1 class I SAM-dependent methyltransferase [Nanoarchaeota archaeon]MBU2443877.1 class I SAM-dependent methyltransferase [Nanoarchaeota archaeon]